MAIYYDGYDWDIDGFPCEYVYGDRVHVDDYYMDERWKPIYYAPGYWVSNKGRVYSNISESFVCGTQLKNGHVDMSLRIDGRRAHRYLHRLVAEAFIPNPSNCPEVRHLDDDPSNNEVWNLAWGDQYDNMQDCIRNGHFRYFTRENIERANEIRRTPVVAIRLRDGIRLYFNSQQEASRQLGIEQSCISAVIRGRSRSAGGYYFMLQDDEKEFVHTEYAYQRRGVPIKAVNLTTGETRIYSKSRRAAEALGIAEASISNILHGKARSTKGWTFIEADYEEDL